MTRDSLAPATTSTATRWRGQPQRRARCYNVVHRTGTGAVVPPAYEVVPLAPPFGDLLQVELEWAQRREASAPQSFRLSVMLVGQRHIFVPELGL